METDCKLNSVFWTRLFTKEMVEVISLRDTCVFSVLLLPVCPHDCEDLVIYNHLGPVGTFHAMTYVGYCFIYSFCKYFLIVYHVPDTVCYLPSLSSRKYHGRKPKFMAVVMPPMAFCSFTTSWNSQAPVEGNRPLEPSGSKICNGS